MNAQEAAKVIHQGMEKLSLSQLMSVRGALQDEAEYAQQFGMVDGFAKTKLGSSVRSTKEVQQKMTLDDAQALQQMVDHYGWDDKDNLTPDALKALEISARISKREKDKKVVETVAEIRKGGTLLTQAQKDVLDGHGFMYGENLESLGDFQNADEALKVLRDEGVLNSVSPDKKPTDKEKEAEPTVQEEIIRLTPEQIEALDRNGIMHDGTLNSLGWFKDKKGALKILNDAYLKPEKEPITPIMEVEEIEDKNAEVNNNNLSTINISKNMQQLAQLSETINPMSDKDERFADSRNALNVLDVYDEKGNKYDTREVLVEQAKLKTEMDLHDAKKVTTEDYVERLKLNIDVAVFSILSGNEIANYKGDKDQLRKNLQAKIDVFTKASEGQPSKAHVRMENVLGFMSAESARLDSKIDKVESLIGNLPIVQNFKTRLRNLDAKGEKQFGAKTWGVARGMGLMAEKAAPALAMAAIAGFGGPIGVGLYAAYTFKKYAMPFVSKYTSQSSEQRTGFGKFAKANKKEAVMAGLYTASAGLSVVAAGIGALSHIGDVGVISQATLLSKHTNIAKAAISATAMVTRSAVGVYEAQKAGDKKELKKRLLIGVASIAAFAGGMWAREAMSKYFIGETSQEKLDMPSQSSGEKSFPIVDRDGDGIPDMIDRDGGDGSANEPVAPVHVYDDFYHGAEVEARSHNSVISLLTNSQVSHSEATLKAEMMISRVGNMDDSVRQAFPSTSDAQIAHAILLRASDVHKGDADELLRALLGDENCRKLTMEQQVSEIRKGLTGYNYGQRTDLPFGRNLDPNYVGMNTRSRFLLDDCDSERLTDRFGQKIGKEIDVEKDIVVEKKIPQEPQPLPTQPQPEQQQPAPQEPTQPRPAPQEPTQPRPAPQEPAPQEAAQPKQEPVIEDAGPVKSYKEGQAFVYKSTQSGAHDAINDITVKGGARMADGKFRYVSYEQHLENLKALKFSEDEAQKIVNERIVSEQKEFNALKERGGNRR